MDKPIKSVLTNGPVQHFCLSSNEEELVVVLPDQIWTYHLYDLVVSSLHFDVE
jgi:hypothetical protein